MLNYNLCLSWLWDKKSFPEYKRILKDYGLGKLVSILPPYREQFLNYLNGRPFSHLRLTPARQTRLQSFHQFLLDFALDNEEKIYVLRPRKN